MIKLEHVSRIYRSGSIEVSALKSISFSIEAGEYVAITGPSGSGKSTLLYILGLLDRPTKGSYWLGDRELSRLGDDDWTLLRSRTIGFVFQQFSLLARTSAEANVMLPLIYGASPDGRDRAHLLLEKVGLAERMDHVTNQLSGGQQQRVAIARALINQPALILADEPTGNLDSSAREEVLKLFRALHHEGMTVIIVTHEDVVSREAGRVLRIEDGRLVKDERRACPRENAGKITLPPLNGDRDKKSARTWITSAELANHFKEAIKMLLANRLRSFLSMLGIFIGVACLIAMLAVAKGAQVKVEEELSRFGSNLLRIRPGPANLRGATLAVGDVANFTFEDLEALRTSIAGVKSISGSVDTSGQLSYQNKNWRTRVNGVSPAYISMYTLDPPVGRNFTAVEEKSHERVVLLGQTVVRELFENEDPVGKMIRLDRQAFRVLGVLAEKGANAWRDQDDIVMIPLRTAMNRLMGEKYIGEMVVQAEREEDMPAMEEEIKELLRRRHRVAKEKVDPFNVRNMTEIQRAQEANTKTFSLLLGVIAGVSLLVGGIGIMNIMLVSVTERTREIGIRKAVGARAIDVLSQFLVESTVLAFVGGWLGILFGIAAAWMVARAADWPVIVSLESIALAFFFSVGVGVIFGLWPAQRASRLDPIQALRYE